MSILVSVPLFETGCLKQGEDALAVFKAKVHAEAALMEEHPVLGNLSISKPVFRRFESVYDMIGHNLYGVLIFNEPVLIIAAERRILSKYGGLCFPDGLGPRIITYRP